ncbi:MAG: electron transfer flavoprotein subunit alpha [Verrucomicrobia bacterium]|nr:electron transfer flavoprotein subunit alpha [Verrucomicrobiota bacterium]
METILFLSHANAGKPALETLAAAISLKRDDGTLIVGLFGEDVQTAANQFAGCGAAKFLGVAGPDFAQARYASDAAAAEALVKAAKAAIVVVPATSRMNRIVSGVAHRCGGRADTHVTGVSATGVTRWYYRQRMEASLTRTQRPWFIALDPGCHTPYTGEPGTVTVESVPVTLPAIRTTVTGVKAPEASQQTIRPDAKLLFVAGAGWTKKQSDGQTHVPEAAALIMGFLNATKASLGSSKSLVDLSGEGQAVLPFMSHLNQVGQTGSTPRHPKGLSTCCHGEEPHAVGWRFIGERRAINLDPNCGWARGKTDVLYVADAFAVMSKVNELLSART